MIELLATGAGCFLAGFFVCAVMTVGKLAEPTDQFDEGFDAGVRFCAENVVDGMRGEG